MRVPQINRYRVEQIEVPAPKDEQQIIYEVLGHAAPTPPPGNPRRVLQITLEGEGFPTSETPLNISIGDQTLSALEVSSDGRRATGLIERLPSDGEAIAIRSPAEAEGAPLLAGRFDRSRLDDTALA